MNEKKGIVPIAAKHIEAGIKKYNGASDQKLNALIQTAGFNYSSYVFTDGRILLVLPGNIGGILYDDLDTLYKALDLAH